MNTFEQQLISMSTSVAVAFSLPKSVGAIFGAIFASPEPLALDDLVAKLEISKGSASMGLNFLQTLGAIKPVYRATDRRTLYEPEVSLRRLLMGILHHNVIPNLKQSGEQLQSLRQEFEKLSPEEQEILETRMRALESWNKKGKTILPFMEKFLGVPLAKRN